MATTSIRIPAETHRKLKALSSQREETLGETLEVALQELERRQFAQAMNRSYSHRPVLKDEMPAWGDAESDGLDFKEDWDKLDEA